MGSGNEKLSTVEGTQPHKSPLTRVKLFTRSHTNIHKHTQIHAHTPTSTQAHGHIRMHTDTSTLRTHTVIQICIYIHTRAHITQIHSQTLMYTSTQTQLQTHTCVHKNILISSILCAVTSLPHRGAPGHFRVCTLAGSLRAQSGPHRLLVGGPGTPTRLAVRQMWV